MFIILYNFRVKRNDNADKMLQVLKVIPQALYLKINFRKLHSGTPSASRDLNLGNI